MDQEDSLARGYTMSCNSLLDSYTVAYIGKTSTSCKKKKNSNLHDFIRTTGRDMNNGKFNYIYGSVQWICDRVFGFMSAITDKNFWNENIFQDKTRNE